MISQKLYRQCLLLYPESFRQEFGDEMLEMFEDCKAAQGFWIVLADVVFSAVKQQASHSSTSLQESAPLYAEIAWSPKLARVFAGMALSAGLITAVLVGGVRPKASESWTLLHSQHRVWFPRGLAQPSCSEGR